MDATTPMSADLQRQQDRKRKRKAILAGGVVLGLGAAVTLAAWSDDVFANGMFQTGEFELEATMGADQTNETGTWSDHDTTPGGPLTFNQVVGTTDLVPNTEVFAPLAVRLSDDTTVDASYVLTDVSWGSGADTKLTGSNVTYAIYPGIIAANCNETGTESATAWYTDEIETVTPATARNLTFNPQQVDTLCIGVTLNATTDTEQEAAMGATASQIVWQFTGTSA